MAKQDYFCVGAVQPEVFHCNERKEIPEKNLNRWLQHLDSLVPFWTSLIGAPCRLVVFPEFGLHGIPWNHDGRWDGVAIDIPGEETELLGKKAQELGIYIAAHAWQEYPTFPGRPFSVGFLISPEGKVILKHHKVVVSRIVESGDTAPGDAYDWFVEKFGDGPDAFFPVADTELGKIGFLICAEGHYAEISRGLALNGAEIILRPNATSDPHMTEPQDIMTVVSRFNAFTNMCYLVESNWSYYRGTGGFPYGSGAGGSQIVDYKGRILAKVYGPAETGVASEVNMQSLRRYRKESAFGSRMVYIPTQIFRKVYETDIWPLNTLMEKEGSMTTAEWDQLRREVIERRSDIYAPPENK